MRPTNKHQETVINTIPDLFRRTIGELNYGDTEDELSAQVKRCVEAAAETGRMAKLTLVLKFKPAGGRAGQVEISDSIKSNLPELDRGTSLFFVTPDGNLTRENPTQRDLDITPNTKTAKIA